MKRLLLIGLLFCASAQAEEKTAHGFSVVFKPMSFETNTEELLFQVVNAMDTMQTLQVAKHPECRQEVGSLSLWTGSTPSKSQVLILLPLTGVLHYGVTRLIEHEVDIGEPSARMVQRVWQSVTIGAKAITVKSNFDNGTGLTGIRNCP